ncbi:MAG: hypothetical protein JSS20_20205, partial [Proteobacteria bacterium]|nr:hypothetical protein [Pseudomonadota bacterium]
TNRTAAGGEGLFADFGIRAPSLPLTANFWNHESIAEQHRLMTMEFIDKRDQLLRAFDEARKQKARQARAAVTLKGAGPDGVPDQL